jgi:hypothetical protein
MMMKENPTEQREEDEESCSHLRHSPASNVGHAQEARVLANSIQINVHHDSIRFDSIRSTIQSILHFFFFTYMETVDPVSVPNRPSNKIAMPCEIRDQRQEILLSCNLLNPFHIEIMSMICSASIKKLLYLPSDSPAHDEGRRRSRASKPHRSPKPPYRLPKTSTNRISIVHAVARL